jgi:hypothetical protein
MKRETQEKLFNSFVKEMGDTMLSKGQDYTGEDVLSLFKLVSEITSVPVEQVLMVFIATKTVRLGNLLKQEKKPNNESVQDNLKDLCNYNILLDMIRNEKDGSDLENSGQKVKQRKYEPTSELNIEDGYNANKEFFDAIKESCKTKDGTETYFDSAKALKNNIEKVINTPLPKREPKVGDKAIIINSELDNRFMIGDKVEIKGIYNHIFLCFSDNDNYNLTRDQFELIEREPKVGDKVRVTNNDGIGFMIGDEGNIIGTYEDDYIVDVDGGVCHLKRNQFELI